MTQVQSPRSVVDDTVIMRTSSSSPSSTANSEDGDRVVNTSAVATDSVDRFCVTQREMPNIKKIPKTVETIHVVQRQCPPSRDPQDRWVTTDRVHGWGGGGCPLWWRQVRATQTRKKDLEVATDPVHRQDLWCSRGDATQVPTVPMRWTTDACDSDVQKDDSWSCHRPSTQKGTRTSWEWDRHQASVIQTVQETAEVPQRLQLDRVVDAAVETRRHTTDDPMFRWTQGCVQGDGWRSRWWLRTTSRVSDADVRQWRCWRYQGHVRPRHADEVQSHPSFRTAVKSASKWTWTGPKRRASHGGDAAAVSSANSYSSDMSSLRIGAQELWVTSLRHLMHSVDTSPVVVKPRGREKVAFRVLEWRWRWGRQKWGAQESAWIACVRDGNPDPSPALHRI